MQQSQKAIPLRTQTHSKIRDFKSLQKFTDSRKKCMPSNTQLLIWSPKPPSMQITVPHITEFRHNQRNIKIYHWIQTHSRKKEHLKVYNRLELNQAYLCSQLEALKISQLQQNLISSNWINNFDLFSNRLSNK